MDSQLSGSKLFIFVCISNQDTKCSTRQGAKKHSIRVNLYKPAPTAPPAAVRESELFALAHFSKFGSD
jgi:hypothetical protein